MRPSRLLGVTSALALAVALAVAGVAPTRAQIDFLPLDAVREGMVGYGLTVFQGARVDTFGVRVLGVQRHARVGGNVIIVEVNGRGLDLTAIAQGMSGSPVYLDGKFAGAVSFSWEGALRPIGGLTPAEEMLALPVEPGAPLQEQLGAAGGAAALLDPDGRGRQLAARLFGTAERQALPPPAVGGDEAAPWPDPAALAARLLPELAPVRPAGAAGLAPLGAGLLCRPAGGTAAGVAPVAAGLPGGPPPELVPGAACAVSLVQGDAELGAIGTVSWRDGARVGLFGHPLLQAGPVAWPLAAAEIVTVFPSRQMSFKLGGMGAVVGAVHHDLRAGLAGRLGETAPLVPVRVKVARPSGDEDYAFQVARDSRLTPALVYWCLYNALLARGDDLSRQTIRYRLEADWTRGDGRADPCAWEGVLVGPTAAAAAAPEWSAPLQIVFENRHEPLALASVTAVLRVEPTLELAVIGGVDAPTTARAGQTVPITITLQPRRGVAEIVSHPLRLPERLAPGEYRLLVASAQDVFALEAQRAQERFADRSLAATLELVRTPRSATDLEFVLYAPPRGVTVDGRELPDLPGSVAAALRGDVTGRVAPTRAEIALRERVPGERALQGAAILPLTVLAPIAPTPQEARP